MAREYPHDLVAERSLLGSMLISSDICQSILSLASKDDFYLDSHRILFEAMQTIYNENRPVDVTTVTSYLMDKKLLDKIGGVEYLLELSESVPTTAHSEHYLRTLNEKSLLRRLIKESTQIIERAYDDVGNINDFIGEVEKDFLNVTRDRNAGEFQNVKSVIQKVTDRLVMLQKADGKISGVKTGYYDLDNIIKLESPQLIVCSSADNVIETFFTNILKNLSVDQKISALYIDNNLEKDCSENIKKEREIIFENKMHEMEILPMLLEVSDNTLDDIVSNITMLDRYKLMDNRIAERVLTQEEIKKLSKNNKVELIDIIDGKKYIGTCELFNQEEKDKIKKADLLLKSSPLFLEHTESISLNDFKELCYEYKKSNKVNIILLNNINTIKNSSELEIFNELQKISKNLNITIIIGYSLIKKDIISFESELENIKQKCNYIDTIFFLKEGTGEDLNILHIWVIKNKNNTLGKVSLLYLDEYKKCINLEKHYE